MSFLFCLSSEVTNILYPANSIDFSISFSLIVTLILLFVLSPFLSTEVKVTNLAQSPYSDFFACEAAKSFAFSTSFFIS